MKFPKLLLLVHGFIFFSNNTYSQDLSARQVKEDLVFLRTQMETYHAGLQVYNPRFNQQSDSLLNSVQEGMSLIEYFRLISRQVNFGHEGHYDVGSWSDTVHTGFANNAYRYLPMAVHVQNHRIFIMDTYTGNTLLNEGDEILSVNNKKTADILDHLYSFMASDGYIESNMDKKLTDAFNWKYYLYVEQPEEFVMEYKERTTNEIKTVTVKAITIQQMRENYPKTHTAQNTSAPATPGVEEVYKLDIKDGTAYFQLKSFDWRLIEKYKLKADKLYKDIFQEIAGANVQNLVVDLRYNTGGRSEFADEMLPYIIKTESKEVYRTSVSWRGKKEAFKLPVKSKWAFEGSVYILVNGKTFSAGATLARYLREYADAIAIGEEAGARYEGFVAGSKQDITLPNSKINIGIPRYHTDFPPSGKQPTSNKGLLPDHIVKYSIDDIINKVDKEREFLNQLLKKNGK